MARQALVVLLLVVFTVVGGASAAIAATGGVTPPRSLSGPESAAAHTRRPDARPAHRPDRAHRPPDDTRRTRTATVTGHDRTDLPAVPRPWVATDHIRVQHQLPPPGPGGALLPGPFGIQVPLPARQQAPDAPPSQPTASAWRSPAYGALRGRTVPSATVLLDRSDGASSPR